MLRAEDLRLLEAIRENRSLHWMEVGDQKVLFRVDGLITTVSSTIFELCTAIPHEETASLVRQVAENLGQEEVTEALKALHFLAATGVVSQVEERQEPEPALMQPSGILLMVTQTCNLGCVYCYAGGGTYGSKTKLLSSEKAETAIDWMLRRAPDKDSFTVTFFGGEPLLNFPLIERVVSYCQEMGLKNGKSFSFSMTTNATVMTDEMIAFLKRHRFTIMVSYDGAKGQEENRKFADGRGSNAKVSENIHRMTSAGLPVQLRATLVKGMVEPGTLRELVQIGKQLGARRVLMSPVSTTKNALFPANEDLALEPLDYRRLDQIYRDITTENLEQACRGNQETVRFDAHLHIAKALARGEAAGMGRCGACYGMSAVATDGKVYPCHRFVGMEDYAIRDLEGGVDAERVRGFFAKSASASSAKCSSCWVRLLCTGGCFYHNADGKGGFVPPEDSACESYRETVKFAVGLLLRLRGLPAEDRSRYFENTQTL